MRIPFFLLLLSVTFTSHATPTGKISPEQAFDLFARALLESDSEAGETLHRAMHAAGHSDAPLAIKATHFVPDMVEALSKGEIDDDVPPEFGTPLGEVLRSTYLRSHCRATSAGPAVEVTQGLQQVTVSYRCRVPDWNAATPPLTDAVIGRMRTDPSFAYGLITTTVPTLPRRTIVDTVTLTADADGNYFFADGQALLAPLIQSTMPMIILTHHSRSQGQP